MAEYQWVGREVASDGATADKILKYCFNDPRNWLVKGTTAGGSQALVPSTLSPSTLDIVRFGNKLKNTIGWTSAKSPCLYGGHYNWSGVTFGFSNHIGSWAFSGTTASFGGNNAQFDWTINYLTYGYSGRLSFEFFNDEPSTSISFPLLNDLTNGGYPFPYLGGGITGPIAEWCAARDGVTVGFYSIGNAGGIHNPENNLKLIQASNNIFTEQLHRVTEDYTENASQENGLNKLIIDIENVPGYINSSINYPVTSESIVYTHGTGVILRNMFANTIKLNYDRLPIHKPGNIHLSRDAVVDHGIKLINPMAGNLLITAQQKTHIIGGELSRVLIDFSEQSTRLYGQTYGYALSLNQFLSGATNDIYPVVSHSPAPPIIFENGWDYVSVHATLYGLTGAQLDALDGLDWNYRGSISSTAKPVRSTNMLFPAHYADSASVAENNEGYYIYPFSELHQESEWRNYYHDVIVKPGLHSGQPSPDTVQLCGWSDAPVSNFKSLFIRPRLLMSGRVGTTAGHFIPRIRLNNAVAAIDPVVPPESVTNISINMEHNSVVDFTALPSFQKWFCGYMNGTGGFGVIDGGIIFDDISDNMIKGDSNRAFYASGWIDDVDIRTSGISGSSTPSLPSVP